MQQPKRILLKVSGEVLLGKRDHGIDPEYTLELAKVIKQIHDQGIDVAIVIGGGNIFRGMKAAANGMDRSRADYIGMLATIMNGLALQDACNKVNLETKVLSAINVPQMTDEYTKRGGITALSEGKVVICVGGTGNPYFTTDSGAALRALELECDLLLKGTKVDGVYDKDPVTNPDAQLFKHISFHDVIEKELRVMDQTAIAMCKDNDLPLQVFNMTELTNIVTAVNDQTFGTYVSNE